MCIYVYIHVYILLLWFASRSFYSESMVIMDHFTIENVNELSGSCSLLNKFKQDTWVSVEYYRVVRDESRRDKGNNTEEKLLQIEWTMERELC